MLQINMERRNLPKLLCLGGAHTLLDGDTLSLCTKGPFIPLAHSRGILSGAVWLSLETVSQRESSLNC